MVPARVALALQADGWVLRQDIIWKKLSPMPESVTNRCTKSHEHIFLLTKRGSGYYYDATAIREKTGNEVSDEEFAEIKAAGTWTSGGIGDYAGANKSAAAPGVTHPDGRNKRDVWETDDENALLLFLQERYPEVVGEYVLASGNKTDVFSVASQSYSGAHFAVFGERLITPCILAGSSEGGACPDCGAPYRRVTEEKKLVRDRPHDYVKRTGEEGTGNSCANTVAGVEVKTVGWQPTCGCHGHVVASPAKRLKSLREAKGIVDDQFQVDAAVRAISGAEWAEWQSREHGEEDYADAEVEDHVEVESLVSSDLPPPIPCVVLDIFAGSSTTLAAAIKHGRVGWGIELSEKYILNNSIPRITGRLLELGLGHLVPGHEVVRTEMTGGEVEFSTNLE